MEEGGMGGRALLMLSFLLSLPPPLEKAKPKRKRMLRKRKISRPIPRTYTAPPGGRGERKENLFWKLCAESEEEEDGPSRNGRSLFLSFFERCPPQVRAVRGMGIVIRVPAHYCRPSSVRNPKCNANGAGHSYRNPPTLLGDCPHFLRHSVPIVRGRPQCQLFFLANGARTHTREIVFSPDCANTP